MSSECVCVLCRATLCVVLREMFVHDSTSLFGPAGNLPFLEECLTNRVSGQQLEWLSTI